MPTITPLFQLLINTRDGRNYDVPAIKRIEVKTSRDSDPDTAAIDLPALRYLTKKTFAAGDEVIIKFGHSEADYGLKEVFWGLVKKVGPNMPVSLQCEDFLGNLKRCWHKDSAKKNPATPESTASLQSIMQDMIDNMGAGAEGLEGLELVSPDNHDYPDWKGELFIGSRQYGETFEKLLQHGWDLFMLPGTQKLYFGPRNQVTIAEQQDRTPIFRSGLNVIDSNLDFEQNSGIKWVEVRAEDKERKSTPPDGYYPLEVSFDDEGKFTGYESDYEGDKNGEIKKFDIPGISKSNAQFYARILHDANSRKGLSGDFKTFGLGYYKHWMKCQLEVGYFRPTSQSGVSVFEPIEGMTGHHFPSGIDYLFSPTDGFKISVYFENSRAAA